MKVIHIIVEPHRLTLAEPSICMPMRDFRDGSRIFADVARQGYNGSREHDGGGS
jgi:hypothetical protein